MRYYIIAGEASGDLHGSNLIRGLRMEDSDAEFRLWGGEKMLTAATEPTDTTLGPSATLVRDYKDTAVMGLTDVVFKMGKIISNLFLCRKDISKWKPDVVILIDYPGFNMKIARFCHFHGIKVFWYIAPKTWASRSYRNCSLRRYVDRMFLVFPFEKPYFTKKNIPFIYKGNPLVDAIDNHEFTRVADGDYVALLPGSRKGEISRMMPILMQVADLTGYKFVIAGAPGRTEADYLKYIGGRKNVRLMFGETYNILKYANSAVINSGTASLEAALIGTPQIVGWNTSGLTYWAATKLLKVQKHIKYISLGNLIADAPIFKELIQDALRSEVVAMELGQLRRPDYRQEMLDGYAVIRDLLGGGGASRAVASSMIDELHLIGNDRWSLAGTLKKDIKTIFTGKKQ